MISGYTAQELARIVQGSPEWLQARLGCVGASSVKKAVSRRVVGGTAEMSERYKLRMQIVGERLGCWATEHYVSPPMLWGIENEPLARTAYELRYETEVDTIGIVAHPSIDMTLCSPDGLVGKEGLIEIKCPLTATHMGYLDTKCLPKEYEAQVHWQLACTGRRWCDFVSFDPRLPDRFKFFRYRVERDEERIASLEGEVRLFLAEVGEMITRLEAENPESAPPLKAQLEDSLKLTGDHETDWRIVAGSIGGEIKP